MRRTVRFIAALVIGLGMLTWVASVLMHRTMHTWFERDVTLRAQLAVIGARQALVSHWHKEQRADLESLLGELAHDERILAACACAPDGALLARSQDFPASITCETLARRLEDVAEGTVGEGAVASLAEGDLHASAVPVFDGEQELGFIVLVHDLGFVHRRENKMQEFILIGFAFLAVAAAVVTAMAARLSWRSWTGELRRFLLSGRSGSSGSEFQPILRDVRELVDRIVAEKDSEREGGAWTPERLKLTLNRYLHGEKVVILANREPYVHERTDDGITVLHPASGLVTALEPVMRACSGTWIAHGSGSADRETVDKHDRVRVPPGEESYIIRRVWLSPEEEKGYYYGFANEGLWPLCHIAHARPIFRSEDWAHYQAVNQKFADTLCKEVDTEDPIVLVQDYHFALAPRLIRDRLPRATVIMFWHIPWPNAERLGICPWRNQLIEGMLGASILGFHTQLHCNNFIDSVDRFLETRIDRERNAVVQHGRSTRVRPYPISLEWPSRWAKSAPPVKECRAEIFRELKLAPDARLGVGVDRLDYTKGVEERLLAVERLLERHPELCGRFSFAQVAAPSRVIIDRYRQLNEGVEQLAARINERFGRADYRPIILLRRHHEPPAVFRYYRAADVCYVSSLHDGMNLVAKEFVAAREDERGVLVLSEFTGAARELTEALIVNPYDLDEASDALAAALNMSTEEQRDRMRSMRAYVSEFNVYRWAGRMLSDAARLRSRDQLRGRLAQNVNAAAGSSG